MKKEISAKEALKISGMLFSISKEVVPSGMKFHEMKALIMLNDFKTENLKEIKERVMKDLNSVPKNILEVKMARTISSLIKQGVIIKEKFKEDKRQSLIITPKGKKTLDIIYEKLEKRWNEVYNDKI